MLQIKKKNYVCALVGELITWLYEMHGATIKIKSVIKNSVAVLF